MNITPLHRGIPSRPTPEEGNRVLEIYRREYIQRMYTGWVKFGDLKHKEAPNYHKEIKKRLERDAK